MSPFEIALNLGQQVHTTRGRTLRGGWGLVLLLPKKGWVDPIVFTPKKCTSSSQGIWILGFCMEATERLKSLYQQ